MTETPDLPGPEPSTEPGPGDPPQPEVTHTYDGDVNPEAGP